MEHNLFDMKNLDNLFWLKLEYKHKAVNVDMKSTMHIMLN